MKRATLGFIAVLSMLAASVGIGLAQGSPAPQTEQFNEEIVPSELDSRTGLFRATRPDASLLKRKKAGRGRNLVTGFGDTKFTSPDAGVRRPLLDTAKKLNSEVVRLYVTWRSIAPANRPGGFDAKNPNSPGYDWDRFDQAVRDASARGLRPLMLITGAPDWAEGPNRDSNAPPGSWKPKPSDVGDFGTAIAKRYSGRGLPKVRDFMLWNEPNLPMWLTPQKSAPRHYRSMLNAFYKGVHGVDRKNRVITGGTAPYGGGPSYGDMTTRPLAFWRDVMCVKDNRKLSPTKCKQKPKFDVLSHHPINTSGGPRRSAIDDDDISTPDLKNLVKVLRAAEKAGNVRPGGRRPVWATELWWESNPPDPLKGNPSLSRQAQWYQESLYLLWKQGASMVLFYQVRDDNYNGNPGRSSYETGVEFADGKSKPSSRAVQFPFIANRKSKKKVLLWGIAPRSGKVVVTQKGKGKRRVAKFKVRSNKIFTEKVKLKGKRHALTAKVGKTKSLVWNLK